MNTQPPKLLDQVRHTLRAKHYAYSTEKTYLHWIKRFILFHHKRHPKEMNSPEIEQFLTDLAIEQHVAASTPGPGCFVVSLSAGASAILRPSC